jgi:transposase-like protein
MGKTKRVGTGWSVVCGTGACGLRTGCRRWEDDGCGELGQALALVYGASIVEQRCIFHKLDNVADKCREELPGKEKKEERKQLMDQARAIYHAESAAEGRLRLAGFAHTWRAQAPKTVATLERDFEQTIAYYRLEGVARELIRTTSLEDAHQPRVAAQVSSGLLLWQS